MKTQNLDNILIQTGKKEKKDQLPWVLAIEERLYSTSFVMMK